MPKVSRKLLNEQDKIIREFNRYFMTFVVDLKNRNPNDSRVYRMKARISAMKSTDHTILVRNVGGYIKDNEQRIKDRDESFYAENIDSITDKEIDTWDSRQHADFVFHILNRIKQQYFTSNEKEKEDAYTTLDNMLIKYDEYQVVRGKILLQKNGKIK